MRSGISQQGTPAGHEQIVLTFPDGREVETPADLSGWLEVVFEDEDTTEEARQQAWIIAQMMRAKFN